ncbi:MAG: ABC transporter substrate-binding protein [Desulfobacteraceae bacterium]|nr:ABC transporter substrate-binding protein [Desulfobacteraceae bacterium]
MQFKILIPFFCVILGFSQFSIAFPTQADQANQAIPFEIEAQDYLRKSVDEILATIQDPQFTKDPNEQEQLLYARAIELFDFKTFSMLSLGRKFRSFSNEQKDLFVYYFSKLISKTYFTKLGGRDVQNITIHYIENTPLTPKKNIFRTDISTQIVQGETQIPITYRMIKHRALNWKIYDIKVAGVSMAANYREQYRQQISQTPETIIEELREKVEK